MKVIIAGPRDVPENFDWLTVVARAVRASKFDVTEVVCGCAQGTDELGRQLAKWQLIPIPVHDMPADWARFGNSAGPIRNAAMAKYADAAVILWDGVSKGSGNMIECMKKIKKPYHVHHIPL